MVEISRRDLLHTMGAGSLAAMIPRGA